LDVSLQDGQVLRRHENLNGAERKLTGREEALLGGDCLLEATGGTCGWTPELPADALVKLTTHDPSREMVRRRLAENDLKQRRRDM
jgi:hypothetical protein